MHSEELSWFARGIPDEELQKQFDWAATDLRELELLWKEYSRIYLGRSTEAGSRTATTAEDNENNGTEEEENKVLSLLNDVDPHGFYFIQQAFVEALVLGTGRLLDNPRIGGNENTSFKSLIKKALEVEEDPNRRTGLEEQDRRLRQFQAGTALQLQRWRNKVVAHNDAQTRRSGVLKSLHLKNAESFLKEAREWLQLTREIVTGERGPWPPDAEAKRYGDLIETLEKHFEMAAALTIPKRQTDDLLNYAAQRTPAELQLKHWSGKDTTREK